MSDLLPEPGTILELIERDHRLVSRMLTTFDTTARHDWGAAFSDVARYFVRHELAEQAVVYPLLSEARATSRSLYADCQAEESSCLSQLVEMEPLSPLSEEFASAIVSWRESVDAHLAHENMVVMPRLRDLYDRDLRQCASRYELARTVSPERPEAAAEAATSTRHESFAGFIDAIRTRLGPG